MSAVVTEEFRPLNGTVKDVQPGDEVLLRAKVKKVQAGVGIYALLSSSTDPSYDGGWVREDDVVFLCLAETGAPEPPDGTWLRGTMNGTPTVYYRDDANGHDMFARYPKCWYEPSVGWITWPQALSYGANPAAALVELRNVKHHLPADWQADLDKAGL